MMRVRYILQSALLGLALALGVNVTPSSASLPEPENGRIAGRVLDVTTGDPLPGANVVLAGTVIGAATNLQGEFQISGVQSGPVTLTVTFLGYQSSSVPLVVLEGETTTVEIRLTPMVLEGGALVVTAQAQGQREAINQQIASVTATNVVSAKKIRELPEANAAEAVGRLPGVTLQREGGEGTKIVIRGLSPQYSKIQMEGVTLSSNDSRDRSTDLSMISSYMLDGIEVTKAATANQEADQLGGTVNFRLREASEKPTFSTVLQGGYNDLRSSVSDYKVVVSGSRRFLSKRIGILANLDLDRVNRGDNSVFAGYEIRGDTLAIANSTSFTDTDRVKSRSGALIVLDYAGDSTKLKLFGILNQVIEEETRFQEILNPAASTHRYWMDDSRDRLSMGTTSLSLEKLLGPFKLKAGAAYNFSRRRVPNGIQMNAQENNAFVPGFSHAALTELGSLEGFEVQDGRGFLHPSEFITKAKNNIDATFVEWIFDYESELREDRLSAELALEYGLQLGDQIAIDVEVGGKIRSLSRTFDLESFEHPMWWATVDVVREEWANALEGSPLLGDYVPSQVTFPFAPFLDPDFDSESFFDGQLNHVQNRDMVRDFVGLIPRSDQGYVLGLQRNFNASVPNDYEGDEHYSALYLMSTVRLGRRLTLIPGVRYERNVTAYTGARTSALGQWDEPFAFERHEERRENSFLLPMLHLRYNFTDWLDLRASYTETLSRPSYRLIVPSWVFSSPTAFAWNNPQLEPIESANYDASLSLYSSKLGLVSIGGFHKTISNFIFRDNTYVVDESQILPEYPNALRTGATVSGYINNPNDATLLGIELEWQSNLWWLPGRLSGLVLGLNYTYTYSDLVYPQTDPVYEKVGFARRLIGGEDASYPARLIDQPDHSFNATAGFDTGGFSIRGSIRTKTGIFQQTNFFPELRQETAPLTLFDLALSQQLPVEGVKVFLNATNLSEAIDASTNQGTGWPSSRQFYGASAQLGIRYVR